MDVISPADGLKIDGGLLSFHQPCHKVASTEESIQAFFLKNTFKTHQSTSRGKDTLSRTSRRRFREDIKVLYVNMWHYVTVFQSEILNSSIKTNRKGRNNDAKLTAPAYLCARTVLSLSCGKQRRRSWRSVLDDKWTEQGSNGATERCHWLAAPHEAQASARKDARSYWSDFTSHSGKRKLYMITDTTPKLRFKHRERGCWLIQMNYGTCRTVFRNEALCALMTQCDYVQGCRQGCRLRWLVVGHMGPHVTFFAIDFSFTSFHNVCGNEQTCGLPAEP